MALIFNTAPHWQLFLTWVKYWFFWVVGKRWVDKTTGSITFLTRTDKSCKSITKLIYYCTFIFLVVQLPTRKTRMRQLSGITLAISPRVRIVDRLFMSAKICLNTFTLTTNTPGIPRWRYKWIVEGRENWNYLVGIFLRFKGKVVKVPVGRKVCPTLMHAQLKT